MAVVLSKQTSSMIKERYEEQIGKPFQSEVFLYVIARQTILLLIQHTTTQPADLINL